MLPGIDTSMVIGQGFMVKNTLNLQPIIKLAAMAYNQCLKNILGFGAWDLKRNVFSRSW